MKKKIYLLFFITVSLAAFAQKYRPLDSTMVWSAERYHKVGGNMCAQFTYSRYYMKGYTLNNGRIWNRLYESGYSSLSGYCDGMAPDPPFYDALSGYVYNDSLNRKVYYVNSLPPNYTPATTDVLYDFNKTVGDTISIHGVFAAFKIDSIDSLLFANKYHKRYHTSATGASPFTGIDITFAEGIGSSIGPFFHDDDFFESGSKLLCFSSPSQTMVISSYSDYHSGYCQGLVIGIDEAVSADVADIYPNPFHNSLAINVRGGDITMYNALGRVVAHRKTQDGRCSLATEHLSPGIYFLRTGGVTRKIIKE